MPRPSDPPGSAKIALFDPKGKTAKLLASLKVPVQAVDARADLSSFDMLIVGREALTSDGAGPNVSRVRDGLKVIVFEQTAKVLEKRFGFRVAEYGLRQVFRRLSDHPLAAGLDNDHLRDWRGEATHLPPRLEYTLRPRYGPTVKWCDIEVPRVWRCGCRGNVASVLIERPARGDFLPILEGGYSLQYSPLLEYREGKGVVLFCQLDVTARTDNDPAADTVIRNLLGYLSTWKPRPVRRTLYAGNAAARKHLEAAGLTLDAYAKNDLTAGSLLIVGPGGGKQFAGDKAAIADWLKAGGYLLALGLDEADAALLPTKVSLTNGEHVAALIAPQSMASLQAGVGPADLHSRAPHEVGLVSREAGFFGNGILAKTDDANVVLCQHVPCEELALTLACT